MRTIKLKTLKIKNFKGIKDLTVDFTDKTIIKGRNGTGKTTIYDAFYWLLFNKDSKGDTNFQIKPVENGKEKHKIDTEVEAILSIDGVEISLKKVFQEKYTKKRGELQETFTGHETKYYINEVPVKQNEYSKKINEILDENLFRLLTDIYHFANLKWNDKRKILYEIANAITIEEFISTNEEYSYLHELLKDKTVEELTKIYKERKKNINKELEEIPARIDELQKTLPETLDTAELNKKIKQIDEQIREIKDKEETRRIIEENLLKKEKQLLELEKEITATATGKNEIDKIQKELDYTIMAIQSLETTIDTKNDRLVELNRERKNMSVKISDLRQLYKTKYQEMENLKIEATCPVCNQPLPEDKAKEIKEQEKEKLKKELGKISQEGKELKKQLEDIDQHIEILTGAIKNEHEKLKYQLEKKEKLEKQLQELKAKYEDVKVEYTPEYKELKNEIENLKERLNKINIDYNLLNELEKEKEKLKEDASQMLYHLSTERRIKELEKEMDKLQSKYQEAEKILFLLEKANKDYADLIETEINNKFKMATFKLFEEQINGGLKETCEITQDGITYDNLNTATKINIGLDIINTLIEYYKIKAPIFIDNAESVLDIYNIDTQMILLKVENIKLTTENI